MQSDVEKTPDAVTLDNNVPSTTCFIGQQLSQRMCHLLGNEGQVGALVLLALGDFDGRLAGHVTDDKVQENVLAVVRLVHRLVQEWAGPFRVQRVIVTVINGCSSQHHGILVGPF